MKTLEQLENDYFMLQMQDSWTSEDYRYADELAEKIRQVKANENRRDEQWRIR